METGITLIVVLLGAGDILLLAHFILALVRSTSNTSYLVDWRQAPTPELLEAAARDQEAAEELQKDRGDGDIA